MLIGRLEIFGLGFGGDGGVLIGVVVGMIDVGIKVVGLLYLLGYIGDGVGVGVIFGGGGVIYFFG